MFVDYKISPFVVYSEDSIGAALAKINANKKRIVYCLSEGGQVEGVFTDGDFRRWVIGTDEVNLQAPVSAAFNPDFTFVASTMPLDDVKTLFSAKVSSIPMIDASGRMTGLAWNEPARIEIGGRPIDDDSPAFLIAEIGNNHNGDIALAKRLIDDAVRAGADCAKFQLRDMAALYGEGSTSEDLGTEYTLDLLKRFQLSNEEMKECIAYCESRGLVAMCTPFDIPSLNLLNGWGISAFKIASADLTNHPLLLAAAATGRPMVLSTGMSTEAEIKETVRLLQSAGAAFVLLHCNSTYPAPMSDIHLAYMSRLGEIGGCPFGYSGHERGFEIPLAAVARGAKIIEKHFTIDRNMEGNDHRVSLLPDEFQAMAAAIRNIEMAMGAPKVERQLSQGELLNRENLAKSIVARAAIGKGQTITEAMLDVRSPGRGLQPNRMSELIGKAAPRAMAAGEMFFPSDLNGKIHAPRAYRFDRPWGVPARYHDLKALVDRAPVDFVEIHFSYRDLDLDPADFFDGPFDIGLAIHSPELFAGDHLMDLSSLDEDYRARSIAELQRVVDQTRNLKTWFPKTERPVIVINAGGFTTDQFLATEQRQAYYDRIAAALSQIDDDGVEIILQTMPPFPWHFGGQSYHNLFMDPDEIAAFCTTHGRRICYDVSHSKLACNYFGWSIRQFTETVGPYTAHLHIVDAKGHADEGLQIGTGEIDFVALGEDLRRWSPDATFIPEIWQGHKNGGEGFWQALDALEQPFSTVKAAA
jgi:sialic acid synthase SpsE/sugar phosphate isomerase/epimerase